MGLLMLFLTVAVEAGAASRPADQSMAVGASGAVGAPENAKVVARLIIKEPGIYENMVIDGQDASGNLVKITADNVTLRNCEIRNGSGNGIGVFGTNVTIENVRIHHMLAGTFKDQKDAHGITGRWGNVTIRNCQISQVSGDCVQFDPDRQSRGKVTIERCTFWTGPLAEDAGGFRKGERPGENGIDTKTRPEGVRSELVVRESYFHGFNQPSAIENTAALNIKEHVNATITNCVLANNEIAFRLRGPGGRGDARVTITACAIYDGRVGVRLEDNIRDLRIERLGFGKDVKTKYHEAGGGGAGEGYVNTGECEAGEMPKVLKDGFGE